MKKSTKIWLITAVSFVLIGCIVLAGAMTVLGWNWSKLSTINYQLNQYQIDDVFDNISVDSKTAQITFAVAEDGICRVSCYEENKVKHAVSVQGNTLVIKADDRREWYDYIGINLAFAKITVYLPQTEYEALIVRSKTGDVILPKELRFGQVDIALATGDVSFNACATGKVKIKTSTGDVCLANTYMDELDVSVTTGSITARDVVCTGDIATKSSTGRTEFINVQCDGLVSDGTTGDLLLRGVIATGQCSITTSTGDVTMASCDAAELFIETDTGDVTGSLLSEKVFITHTDTGDVEVPKSVNGGRCEIITDTGDIEITVQ